MQIRAAEQPMAAPLCRPPTRLSVPKESWRAGGRGGGRGRLPPPPSTDRRSLRAASPAACPGTPREDPCATHGHPLRCQASLYSHAGLPAGPGHPPESPDCGHRLPWRGRMLWKVASRAFTPPPPPDLDLATVSAVAGGGSCRGTREIRSQSGMRRSAALPPRNLHLRQRRRRGGKQPPPSPGPFPARLGAAVPPGAPGCPAAPEPGLGILLREAAAASKAGGGGDTDGWLFSPGGPARKGVQAGRGLQMGTPGMDPAPPAPPNPSWPGRRRGWWPRGALDSSRLQPWQDWRRVGGWVGGRTICLLPSPGGFFGGGHWKDAEPGAGLGPRGPRAGSCKSRMAGTQGCRRGCRSWAGAASAWI